MNIKKYIPRFIVKLLIKMRTVYRIVKYRMISLFCPSKAKFYCPCCNIRYPYFISGRYIKHPEYFNVKRYEKTDQRVQCPVCRAIPRHRILAAWLNEHKSEFNGDILYFAAENGIKLWLKRNHINVTTADLYNQADLKLDITDTHQPDGSWDWVVCNHVLEHVGDYQKALKEIYRILKPGGTLICSFPIFENQDTVVEEKKHTDENKSKRLELYGQADHLRVFGKDSDSILSKAGFSVTRIDGNKMPEEILPVIGPADYDVNYLFLCKKKMVYRNTCSCST